MRILSAKEKSKALFIAAWLSWRCELSHVAVRADSVKNSLLDRHLGILSGAENCKKMSHLFKLAGLPRRVKILLMLITDVVLLPFALWSAVALRFGSWAPVVDEYRWLFFIVPFLTIPLFIRLGLYRAVIRFIDDLLLWTVLKGVTIATLLISAVVALSRIQTLPRSSLAIFWIFAVTYIGASRLFARGILRRAELISMGKKKRVAIYGAGRAGMQVAHGLQSSREFQPVFFIDDNKEIQGHVLTGIKVLPSKQLAELVSKESIDEILLAIPSASRSARREIVEKLQKYEIPIKIVPGFSDLAEGKVRVEDIRQVEIEDLLGRDPVAPRQELLSKCIASKVVMVTGAGGSIGSELCRQIMKVRPRKLILFEMGEFALYEIDRELGAMASEFGVQVISVLGDVRQKEEVFSALKKQGVDTVYHAAAYKHVPLVESNIEAGVLNNCFGTLNCALAAIDAKVKYFVLISSDKAVRPTNMMGATKRLAEMVLQGLADKKSETIFSMVRFGNVLGSSGSVVPLFREQIKSGGPVTVTHPDVIRYFMTISEAATLVIQAGAMAFGGEVFLLDMGEPVKIYDLAARMIELSGLSLKTTANPEGDMEIIFTGLRPGEKLFEELLIGSSDEATAHPRIRQSKEEFLRWSHLEAQLRTLASQLSEGNTKLVMEQVCLLVPGYKCAQLNANESSGQVLVLKKEV